MVILLFLLVQCGYLIRSSDNRKSVTFLISITFIWNLCWLIILQLELMGNGMNTYGSDETDYFKTMLMASESGNWFDIAKNDFNFSYVLYGTMILKTSFVKSVFMIRLCNVMLLINTVLYVYLFLRNNVDVKSKIIYFCMLFVGLNGIITWTAIRNLKDTLFIYLLVIFLYSLFKMIKKNRLSFVGLLTISSTGYVMQDIRQWFEYLVVVLFGTMFIVYLVKRKRYILASILLITASGFVVAFFQKGFSTLLVYTIAFSDFQTNVLGGDVLTGFVNRNILSLPISMARFIIGPGPIRGLFGSESFVVYTTTGNILIFLGGLLWWAFLPVFIMSLLSVKHGYKQYAVLTILLVYWGLYSYTYSGSGDTRLRAVLYVLCIIYSTPFLDALTKKYVFRYFALLFVTILIGSYFSYVSLNI